MSDIRSLRSLQNSTHSDVLPIMRPPDPQNMASSPGLVAHRFHLVLSVVGLMLVLLRTEAI